jgi:uracil-DNA glycosylase
VVVGQAMGRDTQRLTGRPYTLVGGALSKGGQKLDEFLSCFGYSIHPATGRALVYSTDLVAKFPGRNPRGTGDRKPKPAEIDRSFPWLQREIALLEPRVVVPLGRLPARELLRKFANIEMSRLEDVAGRAFSASAGGRTFDLLPVYHPSGAWQFPKQAPVAYDAACAEVLRILRDDATA